MAAEIGPPVAWVESSPVEIGDTLKRLLVGRKLASAQLGETLLPKRIALPVFASDALSSVAYAPDEIFLTLSLAGMAAFAFSWQIGLLVALVMATVVLSYRQTVHAYPSGGGDYEVATVNLGPSAGLVVASALLVDYILTVAVSVSSGVQNAKAMIPPIAGHEGAIAAVVILVWIPFRRSVLGRAVYAAGSSEVAAYMSGMPVKRAKFAAYVLSGTFAALAGLFLTFFTYSGEASAANGNTYTLYSIAAVVLGGVSLFGGRGSAIGAVFGALAFRAIVRHARHLSRLRGEAAASAATMVLPLPTSPCSRRIIFSGLAMSDAISSTAVFCALVNVNGSAEITALRTVPSPGMARPFAFFIRARTSETASCPARNSSKASLRKSGDCASISIGSVIE